MKSQKKDHREKTDFEGKKSREKIHSSIRFLRLLVSLFLVTLQTINYDQINN